MVEVTGTKKNATLMRMKILTRKRSSTILSTTSTEIADTFETEVPSEGVVTILEASVTQTKTGTMITGSIKVHSTMMAIQQTSAYGKLQDKNTSTSNHKNKNHKGNKQISFRKQAHVNEVADKMPYNGEDQLDPPERVDDQL